MVEEVVVGTGNGAVVTGGLKEVEKAPRFPPDAKPWRPTPRAPKPRKAPVLELHWQPHDPGLCAQEIETFGGTGDEPVILWRQCGNRPVKGDSYCAAHSSMRYSEIQKG